MPNVRNLEDKLRAKASALPRHDDMPNVGITDIILQDFVSGVPLFSFKGISPGPFIGLNQNLDLQVETKTYVIYKIFE